MKKTFASFAFGCRVNEAEKVNLDQQLLSMGLSYDETDPDYFIINTCAVTAKAEREVRQYIYQIRKKYPQTKILVTGCSATLWKINNFHIDQTDFVIMNNDKFQIPHLIKSLSKDNNASGYQHSIYNYKDKFLNSGRLMVKIQDGCMRFCSYCIVPHLRGEPISKSIHEIIEEIKVNKDNIKEVILTAINTEYFGKEHNESLTKLLDAILIQTNIPRVSLGSIHPWSITPEFLAWYQNHASDDRFVHYFHIPIQSGSDAILKLMNRGYTTGQILKQLNSLHKLNPRALIGTDIIISFPGETEDEFQKTYEFLEKSPIVKFHIFRFSLRPGTRAEMLQNNTNNVSTEEKKERAKILMILGWKKYHSFIEQEIGTTTSALFLQTYTNGYQEALLTNQVVTLIKTSKKPPGSIHKVKINGIQKEMLVGLNV